MSKSQNSHLLSEGDVQSSILEFLRFKKIVAWRNNNGAVWDKSFGGFRKKNKWEVIHGAVPDILGVLPDGKFLAIEVKKNDKEKASSEQKRFLKNINDNQGVAFVAYSFACVKLHLKNYI
jgi:hypothetical protein